MARVEIEISEGKEVRISEKKVYKHNIKFLALGVGMIGDKDKEIEISKIMQELDFNANWLLWCLIEKRDFNTNVAIFTANDMSNTLKKRAVRGYKELFSKKLVVRIEQKKYMINPDLVIPNFNNYEKCKIEFKNYLSIKGVEFNE